MRNSSNPNYIKSSNLLYLSGAIGFINLLLSPDILVSTFAIVVGVITILIILGLGLLVRMGITWIRYVLLCLVLLGLTGLPMIIDDFNSHPINGTINLIQSILQIIALILLFTKIKHNSFNGTESDFD